MSTLVLGVGCGGRWKQESLQLTWIWMNKQKSGKQIVKNKGSTIPSGKIPALPLTLLLQLGQVTSLSLVLTCKMSVMIVLTS